MLRTKILRDVFSPADFDPKRRGSNVAANSERTARVEFVQKLIDFVAKNEHPTQGCVASKLAAGLDPAKTNELLQNLARVALCKLNERQRTLTATRPTRPAQQQQQSPPPQPQLPSVRVSSGQSRTSVQRPKEGSSGFSSRKTSVQDSSEVREEPRDIINKLALQSEPQLQRVAITEDNNNNKTDQLECLRMNLKKLRPKLEDITKIEQHLVEKLQVSLRKLEALA